MCGFFHYCAFAAACRIVVLPVRCWQVGLSTTQSSETFLVVTTAPQLTGVLPLATNAVAVNDGNRAKLWIAPSATIAASWHGVVAPPVALSARVSDERRYWWGVSGSGSSAGADLAPLRSAGSQLAATRSDVIGLRLGQSVRIAVRIEGCSGLPTEVASAGECTLMLSQPLISCLPEMFVDATAPEIEPAALSWTLRDAFTTSLSSLTVNATGVCSDAETGRAPLEAALGTLHFAPASWCDVVYCRF